MRYVIRFIGIMCLFFSDQSAIGQSKQVIAFASDTQEPMWIERLFLKSNNNLAATKMIFQDIDSLRPAGLFILGDVVSSGKSAAAWKNIDQYIQRLRKHSVPVYATLGNHDVMFNPQKGTTNFIKRFPLYKPVGYTTIIDSMAIILLNSNFNTMTATEIGAQNERYEKELKELDQNPAVKYIIVGCHHSPFTNSSIVNPSRAVELNFLPAFVQSGKAVLFLSGHSHNFERFKVKGKYFVVIGGGGGLHQPLKKKKKGTNDLSADYKPMFHYLLVSRDHGGLKILSRYLKPDFSGFEDGFHFDVNSLSHD